MGNTELKTAFKNALKDQGAKEKLGLTPEILLDESLIKSVEEFIKEKMSIGEIDKDKTFPENNIQANENAEDLYKRQLIAEQNENYISGFATAESNIESLKEPNFEKYFTVSSPESISEYTKLQQQKFVILYALFVEKFKEQQDKKQNFFEFIQRFLEKSDVNQRVQVGLESGFKFSLSLLKEMKSINKDKVVNLLEYLYQTLRYAEPGSLYSTDKLSFMIDSNLNDARDFLVTIIEDAGSPPRAIELAFKILILLGMVRSNVEDLLIAATLVEKHNVHVDLRQELELLKDEGDLQESADGFQKKDFTDRKTTKQGQIFYLKAGTYQQEIKKTASFATDGQYIFMHQEGLGLLKMGTGASGQMIGQVFQHKSDYKSGEAVSLLYLNGKLYLRADSIKPKPFVVINTQTLEEEKDEFELDKEDKNLEWKENEDTGRNLTFTPLFSDGRFIFVVVQKKAPKVKKEEGKENEDGENQEEKKDEDKPPMVVIEVYDPLTSSFKFVKEIYLYKNEEQTPFIKNKNSIDFIKESSFATNGQVLLIQTNNTEYYFDMKTGIRIAKKKIADGEHNRDCKMVYDYNSNVFMSFKTSDANTRLEVFSITNFKKAGVSQGFTREFLGNRIREFRSTIYGENPLQSNKAAPSKLNLIQRIMKNVTTPILIEDSKTKSEQPYNGPLLPKLLKALILRFIEKSCLQFDQKLEDLRSQGKSQSEMEGQMMNFFKFPNATYLTHTLFFNVRDNLERTKNLIDSKKTSDNLVDQYCLYFILKILTANFKALSFCSIALPDLMDDQAYQQFLNSYKSVIVKIIEQGYSQDFEEGEKFNEMKSLWQEIYQMCLNILSTSINLIYSDNKQIISNLEQSLKGEQNEKQAENSSISLNYLSTTENAKKVLQSDTEELKLIQSVFEQCATAKSSHIQGLIKGIDLADVEASNKKSTPTLIQASNKFVKSLSEQLIVQYCALSETIANKQQVSTAQTSERDERDKKKLKDYDTLIGVFFERSAQEVIHQIAALNEHIGTILDAKQASGEDSQWENINDQYEKLSGFIDQTFQFNSAFFSIVTLYIQTFSVFKLKSALLPTVTINVSKIVQEVSNFFSILKKYKEKITLDENKDKIRKFFDTFSRNLCWFIGMTAYKLIKVKEVEKAEEKKEKENQNEKMQELIIQSNLLSGGIENRFVNLFSAESQSQLADLIKISQDNKLATLLNDNKPRDQMDDQLLQAIIFKGQDENVDRVVGYLQSFLERKMPIVAYARLSGEDGMRLSRASFAVMIKFSEYFEEFIHLVNEIEMHWVDLEEDPEREIKVKDLLKQTPHYEQISKRWESASKMRLWISEKKKNLIEKIKKDVETEYKKKKEEDKKKQEEEEQKLKEAKEKEEEEKRKQEEEKKANDSEINSQVQPVEEVKEEPPKTEEPAKEFVDTSTTQPTETQATEEKPVEDPSGLTEADKVAIDELADQKFNVELQKIYEKIVEKAEFLVKLCVPSVYLVKDPNKKKEGALLFIKEHAHLVEGEKAGEGEPIPQQVDWKDRLKSWKQMQTSKGAIKSFTDRKKEIFDSSVMSILACLQTAITSQRIKKQVETVFTNAAKRVAGLKLLGQLINLELPQKHRYDLISWFASSLRGNKNTMSHYLDDLKGCGLHLEEQARQNFFSILTGLVKQLKDSNDEPEIKFILNALKWKFISRDHGSLGNLNIFTVLHEGDGKKDNKLKKAWGRPLKQEVISNENDRKLPREVIDLFEQVFLLTVGRIIKPDTGAQMKLKQRGTSVPHLEKAISMIDENVSEHLISQAFKVIFQEFERYIKIMKMFKGIDWSIYVKMRNKERKAAESKKEWEDENLLDEDEVEPPKEEEKKEEAKVEGEAAQPEESKDQPPAESGEQPAESQPAAEEQKEEGEKQPEVAKEGEAKAEEDKKDGEEEEKKEEEDLEEKEKQEAIKKQEERAEREMKSIYKLYNESFLRRLLRLVEIFTSIATSSPYPLSMVQRVANPYQLETLLNLLILSSPRIKIVVLKVIQNLIKIAIPFEVFEETIKIITKDTKSQAYEILNKVVPSVKFEDSLFLKFLYNYLLSIRHKMWTKSGIESEGQYAVTQELSNTLREILERGEGHENWRRQLGAQLKSNLLNIHNLSLPEIDTIFSIISGGDFLGLQSGSHGITKDKQLITVIGFSNTWNQPSQLASVENDVLKKMNLRMNPSSQDDKIVGLYYDSSNKDQQELLKLNLYEVTPVVSLEQGTTDKTVEDEDIPKRFYLLDDLELVRHLLNILVSQDQSTTQHNKLMHQQLNIHILKVLTTMINVGGNVMLQKLEKEGLLQIFVKYLYQRQFEVSNEKTLIPIEWLELKISQIKKVALENDVSLVPTSEEVTASIQNKKQLIIYSNDPDSHETVIQNAQLISAINLHEVQNNQAFKCSLQKDIVDIQVGPLTPSKTVPKKYGLVFYDSQELMKLDEKALHILLHSAIVVTSSDISPKELFTKMVELVKKDDEKDEKERTLSTLLSSVVLFIRKQDLERVQKPLQLSIKPLYNLAPNPVEGLIREIEAWTGIDRETIMYYIADSHKDGFNQIAMNLIKKIKEANEEKESNQDKLKKLEVDKKLKEIDLLKTRLAEAKAKKDKDKEEKLLKLKDEGFGTQAKSLVETLVEESLNTETKETFDKEMEIMDILKNEKMKEKVESIIEKKITPYTEDKPDDASKQKSEKVQTQELWDAIHNFQKKSLPSEYSRSLGQISILLKRRTLVNILANGDLEMLLPQLLKDKASQKQFACFIKSSFNEGYQTQQNSGQKLQLQQIKTILKGIFKKCFEKPEYSLFMKDFLRYDILESGVTTVKNFISQDMKGLKGYFATQQAVIKELNPMLFTFILKQFFKDGLDYIMESAAYIPNIFNILLGMILACQSESTSTRTKLYKAIISLFGILDKNLEQLIRNGVAEKLLNSELLKMMSQSVDYDATDPVLNLQQKMLLELHLKLLDIQNQAIELQIGQVDSNLENSEGILGVKRAKAVLQQKEKFDFLKYYIHYQGLDEADKELMNQTIETNHYSFSSKVLVKFQMRQIEKLTVKFGDKTKLPDFTFVGISQDANGKSIEYYNQEEIKGTNKENTIFRGDFYLFYPLKRQLVIAFGEGGNDRLGNGNSNTLPKACYSASGLKPQKIFTSHNHTCFIDEDNNLFRTGQVKRSGNQNNQFQKVDNIKNKIKLVSCGKFNIYIVDDQNHIYRQGYSKDGHLGPNTDYSTMTPLEKVDGEDQIQETIVDMSSGTHFTLFVTESGKLYGVGNRFLKEVGLDCDNKIIQIPVKDNAKVLRAFASMSKKQPLAFIYVELPDGNKQLLSAGRNDQGLLGQGAGVKVSKSFRPVKYDHTQISFVDISLHSDHILAISQDHTLYAWGSNVTKRSGFKDDIFDGVFEPKKVQFPEIEKLKPLKVKAGFDHSLILFEDDKGIQKLFSVGQDEANYYHLGITQQEAEEKTIFYREISAFRGFLIVDFVAGYRTSFAIVQGDSEPTSGLYEHKVGEQSKKGLLHFYQDKEGKWVYVPQDEYEAKKDTLPDICFAIKCPIEDLETLDFPDLNQLATDLIDQTRTDTIHQDRTCSITHKPIDGVLYHSLSKINNDDQEVDLSETAVFKPNIYDINPLVYYRIKKPLKQGVKLPIIDLKKYYKESSAFGLDIEIVPDLQYQPNDHLISLTKNSYEEILETVSKFAPEYDQELLREIDKYIKSNLSSKAIKDIKAKDDFKVGDMNFKNPKLKKLPEKVKLRRIELYLNFNQMFLSLVPFITFDDKAGGGDMSKAFQGVKTMTLFSMKNEFIKESINKLPTGSQGYMEIKRRMAQRFYDSGQCDHKGEKTIFGQIFQQVKSGDPTMFRQNGTDNKCFSAKFIGEGSIDAGGPYRECLTNLCSEIEGPSLPLAIKTVNNRNNHGENRDCFIPNPASTTPTHLEMFKQLGYFLGNAIRSLSALPLHFPPLFWKLILGDPCTLADLKGIDTYTWQIIEDLKKQSSKLSEEEFNIAVEETFVTRLSDGTEVLLKPDGKNIKVTKSNLQEYIDLILEKRVQECSVQIKAIKEGIDFVIPVDILKIFTWEEVETRACGDKVLDIERLKSITEYYCCQESDEMMQRFWRVLADMSDEEKMLYLKFVWGRARLPAETTGLRDSHTLYYCKSRGDKDFPEAHTCFFQLDIPHYTTDEICRQRMVTAITMCGEIDADHSADYIPDDNDQEE